jgi:hypothetical protein
MTINNWISIENPPAMTENLYGWPSSVQVLVWDGWRHRIAYYEQIDEDVSPKWRSACSEGWTLTNLRYWIPLTPPPTK